MMILPIRDDLRAVSFPARLKGDDRRTHRFQCDHQASPLGFSNQSVLGLRLEKLDVAAGINLRGCVCGDDSPQSPNAMPNLL